MRTRGCVRLPGNRAGRRDGRALTLALAARAPARLRPRRRFAPATASIAGLPPLLPLRTGLRRTRARDSRPREHSNGSPPAVGSRARSRMVFLRLPDPGSVFPAMFPPGRDISRSGRAPPVPCAKHHDDRHRPHVRPRNASVGLGKSTTRTSTLAATSSAGEYGRLFGLSFRLANLEGEVAPFLVPQLAQLVGNRGKQRVDRRGGEDAHPMDLRRTLGSREQRDRRKGRTAQKEFSAHSTSTAPPRTASRC